MSRENPNTELNTKEKILNATWELLASNQGNGVRMSDIAKQVGISRQALYLHFPTRTELLVATTRYMGDELNVDKRLAPSRAATDGLDRLEKYIVFWGEYVPEIYGVAKALMVMGATDEDAATAWNDRMVAMREGCKAAVDAMKRDGYLSESLKLKEATDILWTLLSVRNWEHFVLDCGWSKKHYISLVTTMAKQVLTNK
ncbi:TetR/AcrR family transcriptional regulator [Aurantivibrio plasticivorans]